jgi:hypothetical protein
MGLVDITDNIVAMGYPAENVEGMYRNKMADVVRFVLCFCFTFLSKPRV